MSIFDHQMETISPLHLARRFGRHRNSVYRWIADGLIPEHMITRQGKRNLRIHPDAVDLLKRKFRSLHRLDPTLHAARLSSPKSPRSTL